jgi:hypothetical protein
MSHLGAELGVAWCGLRRARCPTQQAWVSGEAEQCGQSAREGEAVRTGMGSVSGESSLRGREGEGVRAEGN